MGKLLGAGGSGFFIFYVKNKHKEFREKMKKFLIVPFKFDFTGSQVIYYYTPKYEKFTKVKKNKT